MFSGDDLKKLSARFKAALAKKSPMTQKDVAEKIAKDVRTVNKAFNGHKCSQAVIVSIADELEVDISDLDGTRQTAQPEFGGYTKKDVKKYLGSYLTIRPEAKKDGGIFCALTHLTWDDKAHCARFNEDRRKDRWAHNGVLHLPPESDFAYLVSNEGGWVRNVILFRMRGENAMRGLTTVMRIDKANHRVIPPFLTGFDRRTHSAVCSLSF